jgi:hypothetical protein
MKGGGTNSTIPKKLTENINTIQIYIYIYIYIFDKTEYKPNNSP